MNDKENICLKCKNSIVHEGVIITPTGKDPYTLCQCYFLGMGKNAGYRKTCKRFEKKKDEG